MKPYLPLFAVLFWGLPLIHGLKAEDMQKGLDRDFVSPPDDARPWVYWMFMDGNLTQEGMTADLEAMKKAGLGGAIYMEVNKGIKRGPIEFMSKPWQALLVHAFSEADSLGLQIALATGPGWCGAGGPWITPDLAMQDLVASQTNASGPSEFDALLPQPAPRTPTFGVASLGTPQLQQEWQTFYRDVVVLAFPTPAGKARIADADHKAFYYRQSFSSKRKLTPPFLSEDTPVVPPDQCIAPGSVIDLTDKLSPDGHLKWEVAAPGAWTIMRFGRTLTGQTTRPAPAPGLGLETDKFSKAAIDAHFDSYIGTLLKGSGEPKNPGRGLTMLHFDSWEMGSQNWTEKFREEFTKRRGYDPLHFLPALSGLIVDSAEASERFLWDWRQTGQELIVDVYMAEMAARTHQLGLKLSIEPYDLNPSSDLNLGSVADIPMGEFWSNAKFETFYSCIEAASVGHTNGRPIIGAESFTANAGEAWQRYPGNLKEEGDWALCCGINRFVIHRYAAQPALDQFPGMTFGPYGVHWERTETWWDLVPAYHLYLSRCQEMLRRGLFVADVLYLTPEGAPNVFLPPSSATEGAMPDRRGYNFDGCGPETLIERASVKDGRIVFPDGMSYRLLVLPRIETMTPRLLNKIADLVEAGATVIGTPPERSPSLSGYPACDQQVKALAGKLWGDQPSVPQRTVGKGTVITDPGEVATDESIPSKKKKGPPLNPDIYPSYDVTARVLAQLGVPPDFQSDGSVRYIHRHEGDTDIYFIANRAPQPLTTTCQFRVTGKQPEWWNPVTGECRDLPDFTQQNGLTSVPFRLDPLESGFVIFRKPAGKGGVPGQNFPELQTVLTLSAPWNVAFDPKWGGPDQVSFATLDDWSKRPEEGIKYYSGKAVYQATFDSPGDNEGPRFLSLGVVKDLASVKLNGKDLGIVWCDPWRVEIPPGILQEHNNVLEVTVANLWVNRLIGDSGLPADKRLTSTTYNPYTTTSPLQPSGLLGPVTVEKRAAPAATK